MINELNIGTKIVSGSNTILLKITNFYKNIFIHQFMV